MISVNSACAGTVNLGRHTIECAREPSIGSAFTRRLLPFSSSCPLHGPMHTMTASAWMVSPFSSLTPTTVCPSSSEYNNPDTPVPHWTRTMPVSTAAPSTVLVNWPGCTWAVSLVVPNCWIALIFSLSTHSIVLDSTAAGFLWPAFLPVWTKTEYVSTGRYPYLDFPSSLSASSACKANDLRAIGPIALPSHLAHTEVEQKFSFATCPAFHDLWSLTNLEQGIHRLCHSRHTRPWSFQRQWRSDLALLFERESRLCMRLLLQLLRQQCAWPFSAIVVEKKDKEQGKRWKAAVLHLH